MTTLRPAASFWTAALVVVLALWASAAPSVVYPLYAQQWGLTPTVTTTLFGVYPLTLVVVLTLFGGISDHIGRRASILLGVGFFILGALIFALAPDIAWLYIGRILQGVGMSFSLGAASAALAEFNPTGNPARASSVTAIGTSAGLVGATVVGGALVQYAPAPLHLTFWVLFTLIVIAFVLVWFMPKHAPYDSDQTTATARSPWAPRPVAVPRDSRRIFTVSAFASLTQMCMAAIILSLGATIAKDLIHTDNALVQGLILAISSTVIGVIAFAFRPVPPRWSVVIAGLSGAIAILLFIPAATLHSMPVYIVSQILGGTAIGFGVFGGIGLIHRYAPAHHRGRLISAFYLVGYIGQGTVSILAGITATAVGLEQTIFIFAPVLAIIAAATVVVALALIRAPEKTTEPVARRRPAHKVGR
ncbi:MFS transporter [Streptomyces chiangmaiensis]|uniref:MFS transporter n=1 Tax=Streptomyces chiangmaiensis TaxID=766497 RepID=A0ABU7FVL5_9ACTN|nr:MFS transporter [Streptomyces chiangmaiensis]MED7828156.1 MFS transporter [Streptomyces chiangmaiensis]